MIGKYLKQQEGKTLEFKRDLSSPRNILKTLVAFANTAGGILLIGVEDKSREALGMENPLDTEERLCSIIADIGHYFRRTTDARYDSRNH